MVKLTGTSADLLKYRTYTDTRDNQRHETREATPNQLWKITTANNKQLEIKFDKNFVKKHLFTYTKKDDRIKQMVEVLREFNEEYQKFPKDEHLDMNLHLLAHRIALEQKLMHTLKARAEAITCTCGHVQGQHLCTNPSCGHGYRMHAPGAPCAEPPRGSCRCRSNTFKCIGDGCTCTSYSTKAAAYYDERRRHGKTLGGDPRIDNPLYGAPTAVNTAVILNRIPENVFKDVVRRSILLCETAGFTWRVGEAYKKALEWNFGDGLKGCVINVDLTKEPKHWAKLKGVWVLAQKTGISADRKTHMYKIMHMETSGAHAPF